MINGSYSLRFDHCFSVPSDMDSAIVGTLTIFSATRGYQSYIFALSNKSKYHMIFFAVLVKDTEEVLAAVP